MRRVASAIDMAFGDDLIELINSPAEFSPVDCNCFRPHERGAVACTRSVAPAVPRERVGKDAQEGSPGSFLSAFCARGAV